MKVFEFQAFLISIIFLLHLIACNQENTTPSNNHLPIVHHDVGYIPYDVKVDKADYIVCDSTQILSGRNRIQYEGGVKNLKQDIRSNYMFKDEYRLFSGFVVIRFLVNCEGKTGRYRAQAMNYDFTTANLPDELLMNSINIMKGLDHWNKSNNEDIRTEYLKFINLRIKDGEIEHVLL